MPQTRKLRSRKVYKTHDNGGRPFTVEIQGKTISVSKNMDTYKVVDGKFIDIPKPEKHLFTRTVDEIFIGKKSLKGGYDGLKPSEAEGNSILVKDGKKYLFIGHEIYEFQPMKDDEILSYYSNIGNSDVPYPYAVGKTHIYIMLDRVAVEKTYFTKKEDIYEQFYFDTYVKDCQHGFGNKDICKDKEYVKSRVEELKDKTHPLHTKMIMKRSF